MRANLSLSKVAMFRAVPNFIVNFGVAGDPAIHRKWQQRGAIRDDPQWLDMSEEGRLKRGMLSFAGGGADSRCTEVRWSSTLTTSSTGTARRCRAVARRRALL